MEEMLCKLRPTGWSRGVLSEEITGCRTQVREKSCYDFQGVKRGASFPLSSLHSKVPGPLPKCTALGYHILSQAGLCLFCKLPRKSQVPQDNFHAWFLHSKNTGLQQLCLAWLSWLAYTYICKNKMMQKGSLCQKLT